MYLIRFAQGAGRHVLDLARGGAHAYSWVPQTWIQVLFVSLVALDPLVVALTGFVLRAGIWLAAAVMAADLAGNWIANWPALREDPGRLLLHPVGLLPTTLFGLFVLATAWPVLRLIGADAAG